MINAEGLSFSFTKDKLLFNNISFEIHKGDIVAILGTNGSGKTTLLKTIAGYLIPNEGYVKIDPSIVDILFIPANLDQFLLPWYNVGQNISFFSSRGNSISKIDKDEFLKSIRYFLPNASESLIKEKVFNLSSGEKAVLSFLSIGQIQPQLLILDELFAHTSTNVSMRMINYLKNKNFTIIFTSHNTNYIEELATKKMDCFQQEQIN